MAGVSINAWGSTPTMSGKLQDSWELTSGSLGQREMTLLEAHDKCTSKKKSIGFTGQVTRMLS
jgi:hypothetical protein